jgi:hypothetical protein
VAQLRSCGATEISGAPSAWPNCRATLRPRLVRKRSHSPAIAIASARQMVRRRLARGRPVRESLQAPLAWGEDALVSGGDRRHQDVVCVHIQRDVSNATYPTRRIQRDVSNATYPTRRSAQQTPWRLLLRYHRPSDEASAVGRECVVVSCAETHTDAS